jgi:hypothetical protein
LNAEFLPMTNKPIRKLRIHPAIGIARLGNSRKQHFIGPEVPGVYPAVRDYRDQDHCLKRQAARFRLFAYDENDEVIGEITSKDPRVKSIRWTVHLKNTKAAGRRFEGVLHPNSHFRNEGVSRHSLVLDGGATDIEGAKHTQVDICCASFMNKKFSDPLKLGTLLTDEVGRLMVLGGHGESDTATGTRLDEPGDDFANHDGWFDDTSDGPVRATITWKPAQSNAPVKAATAWVLVAPPKYAPSLQSVITLYDVLYQKALEDNRLKKWLESHWLKRVLHRRSKPSFIEDIYPILRRAYEMKWVFARADVGHEHEIDFARLSQPQKNFEPLRSHICKQFRRPSGDPKKPGSGTGKMPYIWSDLYLMDDDQNNPNPINGTLTQHQYEVMTAWACGNFVGGRPGQSRPPKGITPEGLDRAALEACVGAAFYPGIETSFHIRDKFHYIEPFRLDPDQVNPGDVTQQMSLPWQTDFVDCSDGDLPFVWWPAQRPIDVRSDPTKTPVRWARDFKGNKEDVSAREMVDDWWRLGLLQPVADGVVETQRVSRVRRKARRKVRFVRSRI